MALAASGDYITKEYFEQVIHAVISQENAKFHALSEYTRARIAGVEARDHIYVQRTKELEEEQHWREQLSKSWKELGRDILFLPVYFIEAFMIFVWHVFKKLPHILYMMLMIKILYFAYLAVSDLIGPALGIFFGCPGCVNEGALFHAKYGIGTSVTWYLNFIFIFLRIVCQIIHIISLGFASCPGGAFGWIDTGVDGYFNAVVESRVLCAPFVDKYYWFEHIYTLLEVVIGEAGTKTQFTCMIATSFNGVQWALYALYFVMAWHATKPVRHDIVQIYHLRNLVATQRREIGRYEQRVQEYNSLLEHKLADPGLRDEERSLLATPLTPDRMNLALTQERIAAKSGPHISHPLSHFFVGIHARPATAAGMTATGA